MAHIIRAECIRYHLCERTTVRSLHVKLFSGKQLEMTETEGGKVTGNYYIFHLQQSLGILTAYAQKKKKMNKYNGHFLLFLFLSHCCKTAQRQQLL